MAKMKAVQVPKAGGDFEIVEREIPQPGPGHVRIRVEACGVCHSDVLTKEGGWPGLTYPRVPGHEVAGVIDEVGPGVTHWKKGQRVGVGWHGGQDGTCLACRRGDIGICANLKVCGISYDGGYAEYMVAPVEAVASMPESLDAAEAGPLMCAGVTTFNALRHSGALPSDLVAVQGIGGLGHLGIQFAKNFGYRVAAIGRGPGNAALAKKLGAHVYIDSAATNAAEELQKLGGARVILATAPSSKAMSSLIDGLGMNGRMMVVGATFDPIEDDADSIDHQPPKLARVAVGDSHGLRGHAAFCGNDRGAPDDREVSAGASCGSLRTHDEREGRVPGSIDDVAGCGAHVGAEARIHAAGELGPSALLGTSGGSARFGRSAVCLIRGGLACRKVGRLSEGLTNPFFKWGGTKFLPGSGLRAVYAFCTITSVDLITAATVSPTFRCISSALRRVITLSITWSPATRTTT